MNRHLMVAVFEGDVLSTAVQIEATRELDGLEAGLVDLRLRVTADRESEPEPVPVLDWRPVAVCC